MKVAIVGAGSAGLAIGWRLAQAGCDVELIERGLAARGSTWAAAGMLAVTAEMGDSDDAHARLGRHARSLWPAFAEDLEAASGRKIQFRVCGSLLVANEEMRAAALAALAGALEARGEDASFLGAAAARAEEPMLGENIRGALRAPNDAQVDNRALGEALAAAFVEAGGKLRELCEVRRIEQNEGRTTGLSTSEGLVEADRVIIAAGAWSSRIGEHAERLAPVRPAKGQMAALVPSAGDAMPRHLLWSDDVYLVPREDSVLAGATVEDSGYETSVARPAMERLVAGAVRMAPCLATWRVSESWAGLRPRTADSLPLLGATDIAGLYVASGQFRNGILFTPAIADAMRRMIFGGSADPMFVAFDPRRFAAP
jgi:glycine oxidase